MSTSTKIAGLIAAIGALAAISVAVAQGVPPDARITNPAIAAGQQTSMHTPMGETGVYSLAPDTIRLATIVREEEVAAVNVEPAPIAVAPEAPVVETTTMGAAPAPEPIAKPKLARRTDRN